MHACVCVCVCVCTCVQEMKCVSVVVCTGSETQVKPHESATIGSLNFMVD